MALVLWIGAGMTVSIVATMLTLVLLSRARGADVPVPSGTAGGPEAARHRFDEGLGERDRQAG